MVSISNLGYATHSADISFANTFRILFLPQLLNVFEKERKKITQ
jgi:hypothetical protein